MLIVGGSLAGLRAADTLRRDGFDGPLTVVADERGAPYDRPPLSKQILTGDWGVERVALHDREALEGLEIDWQAGVRAVGLDVAAKRVQLSDGAELGFEALLIATGARPRTLDTGGLEGIHTLRTLDDALAIKADLDAAPRRVVVVGAGFIGAEVAASARTLGLEVTLVEALPVPLVRGLGPTMGQVCADVHRDHGVDLRLGVGVDGFDGSGRVEAVRLADGSTVDADVVVVGIGVVPNTEWLEGSGLELDNGVVCDEYCMTAPSIAAAGDVANWKHVGFGERIRVEHWDNAVEQGSYAARRLLDPGGVAEPYAPVPWFWSDQYDRKIQLAGRSGPEDDIEIVTGTVDERRFAAIYGREGRLVGVLGFNRPRHVMQYRGLIADGASWDDALAFARGD